jgi:hypothetical protein
LVLIAFARNFLARASISRFNFRRMKQKAYAAACFTNKIALAEISFQATIEL